MKIRTSSPIASFKPMYWKVKVRRNRAGDGRGALSNEPSASCIVPCCVEIATSILPMLFIDCCDAGTVRIYDVRRDAQPHRSLSGSKRMD